MVTKLAIDPLIWPVIGFCAFDIVLVGNVVTVKQPAIQVAFHVSINSLFVNANSGFDSKDFRSICTKWGVIPTVAFNYCNGETKDEFLLDDLLINNDMLLKEQMLVLIVSYLCLIDLMLLFLVGKASITYRLSLYYSMKIKNNKK